MQPVRMLLAALVLHAANAFAHGGVAELAVYDRTDGRRLPMYWHEGRAYIVGTPGHEYRITLRSRTSEDLLAVVSVDGVNVITGQTADPAQAGYVLSPGATLDIQGWRRSLQQTAAFYFTSLPDSYAARTGRPEHAGVIGVALFRRKVATPPAPIARGGGDHRAERSAAAEPQMGTGHGRHETSNAYHTTFERATRAPAELIALHYDSRANLLARGVVRDPARVVPFPRPFPGFVPDPQG